MATPDLNSEHSLDRIIASAKENEEAIDRLKGLQQISDEVKKDFLSDNLEVARAAAREFVRVYFSPSPELFAKVPPKPPKETAVE
ncbi:MAG: hypothetical protein HUJ26_03490 [Planctomycetaceae bacterium]|nr:hypothetical protein [Planctomycetaceae bacterium]